jgi:hypothetical protein
VSSRQRSLRAVTDSLLALLATVLELFTRHYLILFSWYSENRDSGLVYKKIEGYLNTLGTKWVEWEGLMAFLTFVSWLSKKECENYQTFRLNVTNVPTGSIFQLVYGAKISILTCMHWTNQLGSASTV